MSYSFNVRGATKALALAAIAAKLDETVAAQPIHAADRQAAEETAKTFVAMLGEPADGQEVSVSVNGYASRYGVEPDAPFTGVGISVTAGFMAKTE